MQLSMLDIMLIIHVTRLVTGKTSLSGGRRVLLHTLVWIGLADLDIIKKQGQIKKESLLEKINTLVNETMKVGFEWERYG